jgi:mono/diheme cytochrome c family protein
MKIILYLIIIILFFTTGCKYDDGRVAGYYYRTDMHEQPSIKPQEGPLPPVEGTVPVDGFERTMKRTAEADALVNPVVPTPETAPNGRRLYAIYCSVCHGVGGRGDGPVAPLFMTPPDITSEEFVRVSDGFIYTVIRDGSGVMPPHYEQLSSTERWLIVNHLRSLQ